ncbi:MAG: hypothetical protein ACOZAO_04030 [Patescibacteria group bacterium]
MEVYIFGNEDLEIDNSSIKIAKKIKKEFPEINFINVKPNEDLPFANKPKVIILDVILDLPSPKTFTKNAIEKLVLSPRNSVHDFDLGFQLKYLNKLGKLGDTVLIGIPSRLTKKDYSSIHSIFKKLVAQDIQGS